MNLVYFLLLLTSFGVSCEYLILFILTNYQ